ncbi:hypothetical protein [Rhodococcus sp. 1168]|uniref:hypothetical protein n=1 Tax=Rhodococcus sp. 1168 TaxID=2018041 RepID=UPI000A0D9FD7|nr:hypothetical protein [Rhodococcus sp. 1168]ORI21142.1 hypothetical protein BJI47_16980 [Rhodococcus sp. 1168]
MSELIPANQNPDDTVFVSEDEFGTVVAGSTSAVAEFVAEWQGNSSLAHREAVLPPSALRRVRAACAGVLRSPDSASYLIRGDSSSPAPGESVSYRRVTRSLETGRFTSNTPISPASLAGGPQIALATAAVISALESMIEPLQESLNRIEDTTADILRLADAERTGDVFGHRRVLQRLTGELDSGAVLTETDWSSVAALGPDLEIGVERLRNYSTRLLLDLRVDVAADDRADLLEKAVRKDRLGETLQLLLIAQESLFLWQRIRVERVELREDDHIPQVLESAKATLREHLAADVVLVANLRSTLGTYGTLRVSEFHRKLSARSLKKNLTPLRADIDSFVTSRALQVARWNEPTNPGVLDALRALKAAGDSAVDTGVQTVGKAAEAVQRSTESWSERRARKSQRQNPADDQLVEP